MRILLVGSNSNYAIERFYVKYLSEDKEVSVIDFFTAQDFFLEYYNKTVVNKIIFRIGLSEIFPAINRQLQTEIELKKPDVIVIFKGMEIFPETLQWSRNKGIKLINYNPDNPFIFSGKGSGNRNIRKSLPLFDLYLTYDGDVKRQIERDYHIPTAILPFGYDIFEETLNKCLAEKEVMKASFVGNPDKNRALFLKMLAEAGIEIDVFGNHWSKFLRHKNIVINDAVYGEDFWLILRRYRVQLNLMRIHNPSSHNMRSFEIPAVGGIQLAPDTVDHRTYFENGKEIHLFKSAENCVDTIHHLMELPVNKADEIRFSARSRSMLSGYSYKDRAKQLLSEIQKLYA